MGILKDSMIYEDFDKDFVYTSHFKESKDIESDQKSKKARARINITEEGKIISKVLVD